MSDLSVAVTTEAAVSHAGVHSATSAIKRVVNDKARFDGRMHGRMRSAQNEEDWSGISEILSKAHKNDNLRHKVRDVFISSCPYPALVYAFSAAIGYVDPQKKRQQELAELNTRFDQRLIARMRSGDWDAVSDILFRAHANGNLRAPVRLNFLRYCPERYVAEMFSATKEAFGDMPSRPVKLTPAEKEKRRTANRTERLADRPVGRSESLPDPRGKKKK